ncbi:GSH1 [Candida pseudojiufengensis]|uniref:GSH1 n=1 Tax=Candida pseudojiufengensis TaxID=497109 RepID=UPI00222500A7|nr:GSH1 [Candida pseudojiufengensis]KAI5964746.1 GSH1 [Candida pseudojiufengensis]
MGLLSLGTPLDWHESKKYNEHVRENGTIQLINIFNQHFNRNNDKFLWGDEVEYMLIDLNETNHTAKLSIDKDYILNDLNDESKLLKTTINNNISFHPEYGRFMLEGTPLKPYDGSNLKDYIYVEENMIKRRKISEINLPLNIKPLTLTSYPRMGCNNFTSPPAKPIGPASQSLFLPDEIINRHARFPTLTANIRKRKGHKVSINLPIYPDINTKLLDDSIPTNRQLFKSDKEPELGASKPGYVYMDSMGFGMGSSCLQITMQCSNINEARYLYDSLIPIAPIMLSLSAAAPIFKGFLVNQDVRWNVICGAVDDRTFIEKNEEPYENYNLFGGLNIDTTKKRDSQYNNHSINKNGEFQNLFTKDGKPIQKIPKSRYDSVDNYLNDFKYDTNYFKDEYNDLNSPINDKVYNTLINDKSQNFDKYLANHFAHLFIRDPLVIFNERINQDNSKSNDHFENIQSTNWQTLRFKPPALYEQKDNGIIDYSNRPGWRVEFRPMEIQITDFENSAYSNFIILLSKAILKFKPNFYIQLSKIEKNMQTAHKVNSTTTKKFWFKSFELWNLDYKEFIGYDFSWFDRYIFEGNDCLNNNNVYLKGYRSSSSSSSLAGLNNNSNSNSTTTTSSSSTSPPNGKLNGSINNGTSLKSNSSSENEPSNESHNTPTNNGSNGKPIEEINDIDDNGNDQRYTINEIINGNLKFPGFIKIIIKLIALELVPQNCAHCPNNEIAIQLIRIKNYLLFVSKRASGEIPTTANWIRNSILNDPNYKKDSKVNEILNFNLIEKINKLTQFNDPSLVLDFFGNEIGEYLLNNELNPEIK